jgi:BirA family biotin operon repressor/biotin-[acetyl-CoA-carboxylase] ligase
MFIHKSKVTSTNDELKTLMSSNGLEEYDVLSSDYQSTGKGQRGNTWESNSGENILMSLLLAPHFLQPQKQFYISKAVSIAIAEVLSHYVKGVSVKWPNDIYVGEKKIAGILVENVIKGSEIQSSIVGMGININQIDFSENLPNPTSIQKITGNEYVVREIAQEIVEAIKRSYTLLKEGNSALIDKDYLHRLYRRDGIWSFRDNEGEFSSPIVRVEVEGAIVLMRNGAEKSYWFKEVKFVR